MSTSILSLSPDAQRQVREQLSTQQPKGKRAKYGNATVVVDGYRFDSKRESLRYLELKAALRAGAIRELQMQPAWRLVVNGEHVCDYVADFAYKCSDGFAVTEDVKSKATKTREYRIKRKLLYALHRIVVQEVA
jgi:hypothetical protein